jgi:signal transduction histidine kinase
MGMEDLLKRSVGTTISIDVRLEDGLLPAAIDSNQVELALLNLVVHARDAMPSGGTISVRLRMRGSLRLTSAIGRGTVAELWLPDTARPYRR